MSTFVSVGNAHQPFQRLLDAVAANVSHLPPPVFVQFGAGRFEAPGCEARAFVPMDEFERRMKDAKLVILHGGGSIIQAIGAGKVPVVMPRRGALRELVDEHQVIWADKISKSGRIVVVHEAGELPAAIDQALALQQQLRGGARVPELVRLVGERLKRHEEAIR